MVRKFALLCSVALAVGLVSIGTAGAAKIPPATGTLTCGIGGTATFSPALTPATPAAKTTSLKAKNGPVGPCTNSGVSGGKYAITGGKVSLTAKVAAGANCGSLASGQPIALLKPMLTLQLTGLNTKGKAATVATIKPVNIAVVQSGIGFAISGDIPQNKAGNKPFGGEHFTSQVNVDNVNTFLSCLLGHENVDHIDFTAAGGSSFTIS